MREEWSLPEEGDGEKGKTACGGDEVGAEELGTDVLGKSASWCRLVGMHRLWSKVRIVLRVSSQR